MKFKIFILSLVSCCLFSMTLTSETFTVEGIILDETGQGLIGANVQEKGTSNGTITDIDGNFTLEISKEKATLVVSYVGYNTQEVLVKNLDKPLSITMNADGMVLEECVVTGYGKPRIFGKKRKAKSEARAYSSVADCMAYSPPGYDPTPVQHNTEDYDHIAENRFLEVGNNPLSTFSIDVDAASYSNMRRFINNGQTPPKDAIRREEMVNYFDYEYPKVMGDHPFEVITEISDCPWKKENKLLHVGLQGLKMDAEALPASNLVFLIDVSGSMQAYNKLPLLQSSFKLLADQLRPQDKIAIVVYAGAAGVVLEPTSGSNTQKIKAAIDKLRAGGSTAGGEGIKLAYNVARENFVEGGNNRIILATDGDFNVGQSSDSELVRIIEKERESGVFLTVMGFGMGNYKDNKMQQLADKGNGNHAYIDNIKEAKKVLVNEFGGTLFTIAKDVKIQIEFNPTKVAGYRLIGYENRMLNKEDFNDDKKDAGELGAGHTVTALYEIIPAGVDSEYMASVDDLKYQKTKVKSSAGNSDEMLTIKLRYKAPDGDKSKLIEKPVVDNSIDLDRTSDNYRFSAAVASFGMLLRDSEFKGDATYANMIRLAKSAKGKDENGYRKELIEMMEMMKSLADPLTAGK